jgi:acetyl-CoA carboxylase biotin carboxylase subunit
MQVVEKESDLLAAIELAKTEGQSFFGNPEVYMEKFLTTPRHVEIQIKVSLYEFQSIL